MYMYIYIYIYIYYNGDASRTTVVCDLGDRGLPGKLRSGKCAGLDTLQRGVQWIGGAVDWGSII